jgi:hypothetical protein
MNPSDDVLDARRIGYDEASANMATIMEQLAAETERADKAERDVKEQVAVAFEYEQAWRQALNREEKAERELAEARAACAAWRELVPTGCACCKWKDRNSDEAACAFCDDHYSKFEYAANPGQPLLDELVRLRAIVGRLEELRQVEGVVVHVFCDNPDFSGEPDAAVEISDYRFKWSNKRFEGATFEQALEAAVNATRAAVLGKEAD